jgi:hypothetical protein
MLVPPKIRGAHLGRPASDGSILAKLDVPVLVTQGGEDKLVLKGVDIHGDGCARRAAFNI